MNLCNELKKKFADALEIENDGYRLYSKNKKHRYYFYKSIQNITNGEKATVIMINPSEKNPHPENGTPDNTIDNLYKIIVQIAFSNECQDDLKISSFEVINLYSDIDSKPEEIIKKNAEKLNESILEYVIKKSKIIIPAWGVENKFNADTTKLLTKIKKWSKNKKVFVVINKYPCHFTTQCTSITRNPKFIPYNFN